MVDRDCCTHPPGCAAPEIMQDIREIKEDLRNLRCLIETLAKHESRLNGLEKCANGAVSRAELRASVIALTLLLSGLSFLISMIVKFAGH